MHGTLTPAALPSMSPCMVKLNALSNRAVHLMHAGSTAHLPRFSAKIHCTYMTLLGADHLMELANDAHLMVFSHELKASGIETRAFDFPDHSVSGLLFRLSGPVASPVQFFATDSTDHFLRGSLYFDHSPNPDSLQPSLDHVEQDIVHLIETLAWPETDSTP